MAATQPRSITEPNYHRTGKSEEVAQIPKNRFLKAGTAADGVLIATGSTSLLRGVSVEPMDPGIGQSYQKEGKTVVLAGDTVAPGQVVTSDSTGRAVPLAGSAAATNQIGGSAVTGGAVDELIEVELAIGAVALIGTSSVATRAALKALTAAQRFEGQLMLVQTDNSLWRFNAASTLTDDTADELAQEPDAGAGCWIRADKAFVMKVPIAASMADAFAAETIPEGFALRLTGHPYWEITVAFSGGSDPEIGISTSLTGYDTKGDLLGGAAGDGVPVESTGIAVGTQGGELDDNVGFNAILLEEGSVIRFDRIADVYAAGSGFVCIPVAVALAPATP